MNWKCVVYRSIIILFLLPIQLLAQKRGVVVDFTTHSPLPFVGIFSKDNPTIGTYSGIDGQFQLPKNFESDTLVFTLLGYETIYVINPEISLKDSVFLKEKPIQLAEATVRPSKSKKYILGPRSSSGNLRIGSNLSAWKSELAAFFSSNLNSPTQISSIELYLLLFDKKSADGYVRINLYSADSNQLPSTPIVERSFLIKVEKQHWRGKWYTVNLDSLGLMMPQEGIFVSIEFLPIAGLGFNSKNTRIRFGKKYPLKVVERIGAGNWRVAFTQKLWPKHAPLIRINLVN